MGLGSAFQNEEVAPKVYRRIESYAKGGAAAGEIPVYEVGDCVQAVSVFEAIRDGFSAVMKIL